MTKDELVKLIREEVISVLKKKIDEAKEYKKRSKGQSSSGTYTSAGTVPGTKGTANDKGSRVSPDARKEIGAKLLNQMSRGNVRGTGAKKGEKSEPAAKLRASVEKAAKKKFNTNSPTKKQKNSIVWSIATKKAQKGKK